jgi:hypothetical protein
MKMKTKAIALLSVPLLSLAMPRLAAAFGFGDITGIAENFAPFISNLVGIDISPYTNIASNTVSFAGAIGKGDFSTASGAVMGSLGDFGLVDSGNLRDSSSLTAQLSYKPESDYGQGLYGVSQQTSMDNSEIATDAINDAQTGEDAQQRSIRSAENTATMVQTAGELAQKCGKTKVSLKCLQDIAGIGTVTAAVSAQGVSVGRETVSQLKQLNATSADLRKHNNRADRRERSQDDRKAKNDAQSAGFFAGMVSGDSKAEPNYEVAN